MRKGHVDSVTHALVGGWAADTERPDVALTITILVDGAHVADVVADRPRPDLAARSEFGDGRHAFRYQFDPPLDSTRSYRVALYYAEDGRLLPRGERVLPGAAAAPVQEAPASLKPILVSGPGRSGTTLLMGLLAGAPEIVAAEWVPYELRLMAYYANAQRVLTHPGDTEHSTHHDKLPGDGYFIGFNPYNGPLQTTAFATPAVAQAYADHFVPGRVDGCFRDVIIEYYRLLALDKGKQQARYFAEKNHNLQRLVRHFADRAFGGVKEIITVRDPRDVMCSHLSWFHMEAERSFSDLSNAAKTVLQLHDAMPRDVYFNPYERLLRGEKACFLALSEFLQTEIAERPAEARQSVFARHGTSADPAATVGRWRRDMPAEWRERCNEAWQPFLERFGYELR